MGNLHSSSQMQRQSGQEEASRRTIAVLLTCFNRREKTLASLKGIFTQELPENTACVVYLVDDASSDGTSESVRRDFPQVRLLEGDGTLFWGGGMRKAFAAAMEEGHDFYLWLNDDTTLTPNALQTFLSIWRDVTASGDPRALIVGSTCDPATRAYTYGGFKRRRGLNCLGFVGMPPASVPQRCDTMNGNCVLIPAEVARLVGNIDPAFTQLAGDIDYGLRAARKGCAIWNCPDYQGECEANLDPGGWRDSSLPLRVRWRKVVHPKGLPPKEYAVFARRYGSTLWPLQWMRPYIGLVVTSLWKRRHA